MIKLNDKVTYRKIEDSILIITPWDNAMHTLEDIGKLIFEALIDAKEKGDILQEILDNYDVELVEAKNDLEQFIDSLIEKEIFIEEE